MSAEREQLLRLLHAIPAPRERGSEVRIVHPADATVFAQLMIAEGLHRVADALVAWPAVSSEEGQ